MLVFFKQIFDHQGRGNVSERSLSLSYAAEMELARPRVNGDILNEFEGTNITSCEGYLYLQSSINPWHFKKRYFTLRNHVLFYTKQRGDLIFNDETDSRIVIYGTTGVYAETLSYVWRFKYAVRLTQGKRSFLLCTASEEYRNIWMSTLLTVITKNVVCNLEHQMQEKKKQIMLQS